MRGFRLKIGHFRSRCFSMFRRPSRRVCRSYNRSRLRRSWGVCQDSQQCRPVVWPGHPCLAVYRCWVLLLDKRLGHGLEILGRHGHCRFDVFLTAFADRFDINDHMMLVQVLGHPSGRRVRWFYFLFPDRHPTLITLSPGTNMKGCLEL